MKSIGNVSIEDWKAAFARAVGIAIEQDYFSDILFYDLYPNINEELKEDMTEEEEYFVYQSKWAYVYEAFKEVFGESYDKFN